MAQIDVSASMALATMKRAMNNLDVSRRWVGEQVGVSGEHIGMILSGKCSPGGALMFKLAALFDFDVGLWGVPFDGDVAAIHVVDKRGRPCKQPSLLAADTPEDLTDDGEECDDSTDVPGPRGSSSKTPSTQPSAASGSSRRSASKPQGSSST